MHLIIITLEKILVLASLSFDRMRTFDGIRKFDKIRNFDRIWKFDGM